MPLALTGRKDPESALRHLRREHDGLLCVTLGHQGALALEGDRAIHVPAFRINAVDTTGAGDVFRGGFIYGYPAGMADGAGAALRERGGGGQLHAPRRAGAASLN